MTFFQYLIIIHLKYLAFVRVLFILYHTGETSCCYGEYWNVTVKAQMCLRAEF